MIDISIWGLLAALGVPTAVTGLLFWWLKRRIEAGAKTQAERQAAQETLMVLLIQGMQATMALGEAQSHAIQRGHPNANISLAAADVNAASKATYVSVTLPNTGWSNNQRTLTVNGVLADATKQLIAPCPQNATALDVWTAAGVKAIAQAANSLTSKCGSAPTASIPLYVAIIPIGS